MQVDLVNKEYPQCGDVYLMRFDGTGSEQSGVRPAVIMQNNTGNRYSPNVIALPLTSSIKKAGQPTHVLLPSAETGLAKDSLVLCENPGTMSKQRMGRYLTHLPDTYMKEVAAAQILATSAISYLTKEELVVLWEECVRLNRIA